MCVQDLQYPTPHLFSLIIHDIDD